jgi:hypothetical protein
VAGLLGLSQYLPDAAAFSIAFDSYMC